MGTPEYKDMGEYLLHNPPEPLCKLNQCNGTGIIDASNGFHTLKAICACKLEEIEYRILNARSDVPPGTGMVYGGMR